MSRAGLITLLGAPLLAGILSLGCSKSAGTKETVDEPTSGGRIAVPGATGGPAATEGAVAPKAGANDARFRLTSEEGQLAVESPPGAAAGTEVFAKVVVTPGSLYKVNTEFPTKLTLETPEGVTIAKAELKAGGHDKAKGDAEQFDESKLTFVVKLTPSQTGSYTVNGNFKFAVCDKAGNTCLAKKEPIAIQVAAQ